MSPELARFGPSSPRRGRPLPGCDRQAIRAEITVLWNSQPVQRVCTSISNQAMMNESVRVGKSRWQVDCGRLISLAGRNIGASSKPAPIPLSVICLRLDSITEMGQRFNRSERPED